MNDQQYIDYTIIYHYNSFKQITQRTDLYISKINEKNIFTPATFMSNK